MQRNYLSFEPGSLLSSVNNISHNKVLEASIRAKSINPDILVDCKKMFLDESNINDIDFTLYDYVLGFRVG